MTPLSARTREEPALKPTAASEPCVARLIPAGAEAVPETEAGPKGVAAVAAAVPVPWPLKG